ncbi:FMN-binding negative transcriptional regulator [Sesbania bispinosa]|nr:FMN-binding negative transcriptional regulator [Sesbania bispinosa]
MGFSETSVPYCIFIAFVPISCFCRTLPIPKSPPSTKATVSEELSRCSEISVPGVLRPSLFYVCITCSRSLSNPHPPKATASDQGCTVVGCGSGSEIAQLYSLLRFKN